MICIDDFFDLRLVFVVLLVLVEFKGLVLVYSWKVNSIVLVLFDNVFDSWFIEEV